MNDNERKYTVYKHTSPTNKIYVGITRTDTKRRWQNGYGYRNNKYFKRAIEKYGWDNFKHEILFENLTEKEAKLMEQMYIALYNTVNPKYGYNRSLGGEGTLGYEPSEETNRKISKALKGRIFSKETREKISQSKKGDKNPMYGKHHSEERKEKLRKSMIGNKNPMAKKVICITTGEIFDTASQGDKKYNIYKGGVSACCRHYKQTAGKHPITKEPLIWRYYE